MSKVGDKEDRQGDAGRVAGRHECDGQCPGCSREIVFCPACYGLHVVKDGRDGDGRQRHICRCGKQFTGKPVRELVAAVARKQLRGIAFDLAAAEVAVAVIARCTGLAASTIYTDRRRPATK